MFALLRANVITVCTRHITSAPGNPSRKKHAEERPLLHPQIWIAPYLSGVFQITCAKVWELCVKPKLGITERMLPGFGKQDSIKHFYLFILADAENSGCRSHVLTSHIYSSGKKMLVCTHREQNKREPRKQREGVTDSGNSRLGPEKQSLCC